MSEVDEEVYTTIFNALRHGVRRRILRMLLETQMTFTAINEKLNISSSHLTYHLDSLKELVSKDDTIYQLSVFGRAAVDMMNGIENPPKEFGPIPVRGSFKLIAGVLLVAVIALSALHVDLNNKYITQGDILAQKNIEIAHVRALISETQFNVTVGLNEYVFDSQDTARLIITNNDSDGITFGSPYFITEFVDGEWVQPTQFPLISGWNLLLYKLPVGKTTTQEIKIDTLESGHYRVRKKINHVRTQTELTFTLEFDIRGEG